MDMQAVVEALHTMIHEVRMEGTAGLSLLQAVQDGVNDFARNHQWSQEALFQVSLAVEETVMNVISHGGGGDALPVQVRICLRQEGMDLDLEIADNGVAFDPTQAPPPDLEAGLADRPVGGLGVFLVHQMVDAVSYRREAGWNFLQLHKRAA
jgi:sigma-B regulation protein RsbU (phosphoserine phosphatase)